MVKSRQVENALQHHLSLSHEGLFVLCDLFSYGECMRQTAHASVQIAISRERACAVLLVQPTRGMSR